MRAKRLEFQVVLPTERKEHREPGHEDGKGNPAGNGGPACRRRSLGAWRGSQQNSLVRMLRALTANMPQRRRALITGQDRPPVTLL
jgi:hypothetical protein